MTPPVHRLLLRVWGTLPSRAQRRIIYALGHKVTVGVAAVVMDARGYVLLVHHTYRVPAWDFPGGLLGGREQPAAALARELREELGVNAVVGRLLHADHYTRWRHITLYYEVSIEGKPRHSAETDAHDYISLDGLPAMLNSTVPSWLADLARAGRPTACYEGQ